MNTKLTIRLIGYSLIAIWAVWLIGRPGDVEPVASDPSSVLTERSAASVGDGALSGKRRSGGGTSLSDPDTTDTSEAPPPVNEAEHIRNVRIFIDRMVSTDQQIERLMAYAKESTEITTWSLPVRSVMNNVLSETERRQYESGELYVECGGLLCFVYGDLDADTTLTQLPLALWAASSRDEVRFATTKSQASAKYGWVFFVVSPDFEVPTEL